MYCVFFFVRVQQLLQRRVYRGRTSRARDPGEGCGNLSGFRVHDDLPADHHPTPTPNPHLHGFTTAAIISIPSLCRGGGSRNAERVGSRINYAYPVHALIYAHIILRSIKYILYMYNILYIRFTCSTAHRNIIIIIIQDGHGPVKVLSAFHIIFFLL